VYTPVGVTGSAANGLRGATAKEKWEWQNSIGSSSSSARITRSCN